MLKAVLDTNQFVSGLISRKGQSHQLLQAWKDRRYILITSNEIIEEIRRALRYPHIFTKYRLQDADIHSFISLIEHEAVVVPGSTKVAVVKDDPDDNKFIACAIEAGAGYIVSGDRHLIDVCRYKDISIVTAKEFLMVLHEKEDI